MKGYYRVGATLLALGATACGSGTGQPSRDDANKNTNESRQAIVGGNVQSNPEDRGVVYLHFPQWGECSGVLISNQWVLTAQHCMHPDVGESGDEINWANNIYVTMGSQSSYGTGWVEKTPDEGSADMAVFQLESPMTMDGSTSGYYLNWWAPPPDSELNQYGIVCMGLGYNTGSGGAGVLRAWWYGLDTLNEPHAWIATDPSHTPYYGDSGGPCFSPFTGELISIMNAFQPDLVRYFTDRPSSAHTPDNQGWLWGVLDRRGW